MISYVPYAEKIVVYWDLPDNFVRGSRYEITLDGKRTLTCETCHIHIDGLLPESNYKVDVSLVLPSGEKFALGGIDCRTETVRRRIDVTKAPYNAVGDGVTMNTERLQRAIDDCQPGECVYVPRGDYMTGSLFLHSDMELYLEGGAIIHGTKNVKDYEPKIKSRFEGIEMMAYAALVNVGTLDREAGFTAKNVRITGEGCIEGGGLDLAKNVIAVERVLQADYIRSLGDKVKECENDMTIPGRPRPRLINISCADNVLISGIEIRYGASWNVHMIYSNNVVTHNVKIRSDGVWNGDGWDPDSSTNCSIFASEFFTGDDAVAIKSGKNPEGNVIARPSEHIRVFDCISHFGHGLTIGSEMSGGINDVKIWNCDMTNSFYGVEIKGTKKRGGYVKGVHVSYSTLARVLMHSVGYNDDGIGAPTVPVFSDCTFEELTLTAKQYGKDEKHVPCEAIYLAGFDVPGHEIKNVKFKNITVDGGESIRQTLYLQCCDGVTIENIKVK